MKKEKKDLKENQDVEEPPPILKNWNQLYAVVLGNLILWITLFAIFTWMFK